MGNVLRHIGYFKLLFMNCITNCSKYYNDIAFVTYQVANWV